MRQKGFLSDGRWVWGLFFIIAAVFAIIHQLGHVDNVGFFSLLFTMFLIPALIKSVISRQFVGIFFSLAFLAIIYAEPLGIAKLVPWTILIAALLLSIGFSMIFKDWTHKSLKDKEFLGSAGEEMLSKDSLIYSVTFGSMEKHISFSMLKKLELNVQFGAMKVYFDKMELSSEGMEVVLNCSFSGVELYIPKGWRIEKDVSLFIAGVGEENHSIAGDRRTLRLTGSLSFSGVKIVYI